jgi:hypothetical protein
MANKPANACKYIRVSYIINVVCLLHVSTTPVTIFREMHDKGCITKRIEPLHKYKIPSVKNMVKIKILKYNIRIKFLWLIQVCMESSLLLCKAPPWGWPQEWSKSVAGSVYKILLRAPYTLKLNCAKNCTKIWTECSLVKHRFPIRFVSFFVRCVSFLEMMPSWCRQINWGNCEIPWVSCAAVCVKDDCKGQFWGLRYCLSKLRSLLSFSVRCDVTQKKSLSLTESV